MVDRRYEVQRPASGRAIEIVFDKPDRSFQPGDTVAGEVSISVAPTNRDMNLEVRTGWRTSGSGTTDRGSSVDLISEDGLKIGFGEHCAFRFSFDCPDDVLTFHGERVHIAWYVTARLKFTEGREITIDEEFLVGPGTVEPHEALAPMPYPPALPASLDIDTIRRILTNLPGVGLWLTVPVLVAIIGLVPGVIIGAALTVPLAAMWHYSERYRLFGYLLGPVEVLTTGTVVSPGDTFTASLNYKPLHGFVTNGLRSRLLGEEVAENVEGAKILTRRSSFHDESAAAPIQLDVKPGSLMSHEVAVLIPSTTAWTFETEHNRVEWSVVITLDIQYFPDWTLRIPLTIVPGAVPALPTIADALAAPEPMVVTPPIPATPPITPPPEQLQPAAPPALPAPHPAVAKTAEPDADPTDDSGALRKLLDDIVALPRSGPDRVDLVEQHEDTQYTVVLHIDRVVRSMHSSLPDGYRDGREVVGALAGTDHEMQVFLLETSTDRVAGLQRGAELPLIVIPTQWDTLYQRLVLRESDAADAGRS